MMTTAAVLLAQCCGGDSGGSVSEMMQLVVLSAIVAVMVFVRSIWNEKGASIMGKIGKIAIVVVLAVAVVVVIVMKKGSSASPPAQAVAGLPRLVDLGSTTCVPCKLMAPILDELRKECAGRMQVEFINVNENPDAAKPFGIKLIPTQVFIDAKGKELWRHEGFLSKDEILAKWKELGVDLAGSPAGSGPASAPAPAVKSGST